MSKLLFFITNCWSTSKSKPQLYCFYDYKSAKEKLLEPGFIITITFAGTLHLYDGNTDIEENEIYNIPYDVFDCIGDHYRRVDYPHELFNPEKYKDKKPFYTYEILSWGSTNGEITSSMNSYPRNSFHRVLYEYFYTLSNKNNINGYQEWVNSEDAIIRLSTIIDDVEKRSNDDNK